LDLAVGIKLLEATGRSSVYFKKQNLLPVLPKFECFYYWTCKEGYIRCTKIANQCVKPTGL